MLRFSMIFFSRQRLVCFLEEIDQLNFIVDESSNISHERIVNITLQTDYGAIHLKSENIAAMPFTAENAAASLRNHLIEVTNGQLQKVNNITTDICSMMFKMWIDLRAYSD
jgi:hypothetical protein